MSAPLLDRPRTRTPDDGGVLPAAERPPGAGARIAAAVAVVAMLAAIVATFPGGSLLPARAIAEVVSGPVEAADGAGWRALAVGDTVRDGTELRSVGGAVVLAVADGQVHLADGARLTLSRSESSLHRGTVVVDRAGRAAVRIGGLLAGGTGAWRVDAGASPRVATYAGEVVVEDAATQRSLPAYRQVSARDGALRGVSVVPMRYLADDPYDRRWMAEAFRVDDLAESLSRSLAATYGALPRDLDFYAAFAAVGPGVTERLTDLARVVAGDHIGPPADLLVAAAAIDAIATVADRPRAEVATSVTALRRAGATWGLVLVDGGAGADDLAAAADRALAQAAQDPPPTAAELEAAAAAADADAAASDDATDGTGTSPPPGTGGTDPGTDGGTSPPPGDDPVGPSPTDPIDDLVDDTSDTPEDEVDDTTDAVDKVVDDTTDAVDEVVDDTGDALDSVVDDTGNALDDLVGGVDELLGGGGGLLGGGGGLLGGA